MRDAGAVESLHAGDRRTFRGLALGGAAVLFAWALWQVEFRPWEMFTERARNAGADFVTGAFPPDFARETLERLGSAALDTLAIAACGIAVAAFIGLPLGILGSRAVMLGSLFATGDAAPGPVARVVYVAARTVGAVFRSIPEVVWALLFVRIYGLGPSSAVLAIGIAYGGMLAKVYSEQLEAVDRRPVTALEAVGAGRAQTFAFGILPLASAEMTAYTAYRFECAIRAGAILGLVGAGGLGMRIDFAHQSRDYAGMCSAVIVLMLLVLFVETTSDWIKRRFA